MSSEPKEMGKWEWRSNSQRTGKGPRGQRTRRRSMSPECEVKRAFIVVRPRYSGRGTRAVGRAEEERRRGEESAATRGHHPSIHNASRHTETKKREPRSLKRTGRQRGSAWFPCAPCGPLFSSSVLAGEYHAFLGLSSESAFLNCPPCAPS